MHAHRRSQLKFSQNFVTSNLYPEMKQLKLCMFLCITSNSISRHESSRIACDTTSNHIKRHPVYLPRKTLQFAFHSEAHFRSVSAIPCCTPHHTTPESTHCRLINDWLSKLINSNVPFQHRTLWLLDSKESCID